MCNFHFGATAALCAKPSSPFPLITDNLYQTAETLAGYGFDSIEYHIRDPRREIDGFRLKASADEIQLLVSSLGTGMAYGDEGLSITSKDSLTRKAAIQRLKDHVDLASILDCYVIIGSMRGKIEDGDTYSQTHQLMKESMKELADYAEAKEVTYVIEAIDRFETNYLCTAEQICALIDEIGSSRIGVHLDSYHMNIEENNWESPIYICGNKLKHFHFADNTRNFPGSGHIPFKALIDALKTIQYKDSITLECFPYPDSSTALKNGLAYLKSLL